MASRRTGIPLVQYLSQLWWQRDRTRWNVRCRFEDGSHASLRIGFREDGLRSRKITEETRFHGAPSDAIADGISDVVNEPEWFDEHDCDGGTRS